MSPAPSENAHSVSRAVNLDILEPKFAAALQQAWCREACWPGCVGGYPVNRDDNPSYGNCLVSALAAYAARGMRDELIPAKVDESAWHFRLGLVDSVQVDTTWQQFEKGSVFRALTPGTEEYSEVMKGSLVDDQSLVPRLGVIIDRMKSLAGVELGYTAEQIVESVCTRYEHVLGRDTAPQPAVKPFAPNELGPASLKL